MSAEILDRAFEGRLVISKSGLERSVPQFMEFSNGAAGFPWRSQAEWIGGQFAARLGLDRPAALTAAGSVFRSDLYRAALARTSADLPVATAKSEGARATPSGVESASGQIVLERDTFFDGRVFEPTEI
jgi:NitT/TauT family transport system ATP-binding protein